MLLCTVVQTNASNLLTVRLSHDQTFGLAWYITNRLNNHLRSMYGVPQPRFLRCQAHAYALLPQGMASTSEGHQDACGTRLARSTGGIDRWVHERNRIFDVAELQWRRRLGMWALRAYSFRLPMVMSTLMQAIDILSKPDTHHARASASASPSASPSASGSASGSAGASASGTRSNGAHVCNSGAGGGAGAGAASSTSSSSAAEQEARHLVDMFPSVPLAAADALIKRDGSLMAAATTLADVGDAGQNDLVASLLASYGGQADSDDATPPARKRKRGRKQGAAKARRHNSSKKPRTGMLVCVEVMPYLPHNLSAH